MSAVNWSSDDDNSYSEEVPTFIIAGHETTRFLHRFPCRTGAFAYLWSVARPSLGASML